MQIIISYTYKSFRKVAFLVYLLLSRIITFALLYSNNVKFKKFKSTGVPFVSIARGGSCTIKTNFKMNNGNNGNPIGRPQRCIFFADKGASIKIGENVGISSTAIVAHEYISIGDNVKIGGGVCIYDTDFHSLDPGLRRDELSDRKNKKNKPVIIGDNVFIGAHTTILKGSNIGNNSIIGACSVVAKDIPSNEIWAGNPAIFIKNLAGYE